MTERILPEYNAVLGQELTEAVFQALGRASVCWEPMDGTGVFDSTTASQLGGELLGIIVQFARRYPHPGEPGYDEKQHGLDADPRQSVTAAMDAWRELLDRLAPEIARDPVADALRKMAEQVFVELKR